MISRDGSVVTKTFSGSTTQAITIGSNSSRLLVVRYATHQGGGDATAMSIGGQALTEIKVQTGSFGEAGSIWTLVAPPTGSQTLSVTAPGNDYNSIAIDSLYGCLQSNPTNFTGASGSNATATTTITPNSSSDWVLDIVETEAIPQTQSSGFSSDFILQGGANYENSAGGTNNSPGTGSLTCTWNTSFGARWNLVVVDIQPAGAPTAPTVTDTAATLITANSAQANGNMSSDGGATVTAQGFCWATTINPTTADTIVNVTPETLGSFSATISGLGPSTTYHYRAFATNTSGTTYGVDQSFNTAAASSSRQLFGLMGMGS